MNRTCVCVLLMLMACVMPAATAFAETLDAALAGQDTDSDGISDALEGRADTDADGVPDYRDLDSDNDGIPDQLESLRLVGNSGTGQPLLDSDGDGLPDYRDLDSDNDELPDVIEAGGLDEDQDGRLDHFVDINGNGLADHGNQLLALSALLAESDAQARSNRQNQQLMMRWLAVFPDQDQNGIPDFRQVRAR